MALSALRAPIRHVATAVVALLVVACSLACAGCGPPSAASGSGSSAPDASIAQQAAQTEESADAATAPEAAERSARAQNRAREYENALEEKDFEVSSKEAALREVAKPNPKSTRYTVMIYMIGSNLESANAAATSDLDEIAESGVDFTRANIVVYAGGAKRWNTNVPTDANSVLDMSRPANDRIVAQTESNASMGASETLAEFIRYCSREYPADHMALVLWDHGGGPLWGYGYDEVSGGDGLLLSELRDAMQSTDYAEGKKRLDWVGFDACLMGSLENAALWSDYTHWMVASEEVEPGGGWDYSFLATLNGTSDPKDIGASIVSSYAKCYEESASAFSNPDVTMALFDLSKVGNALKALDGLAAAMAADMDAGEYAELNRARRNAKAFGLSSLASRSEGYDLVDIADLAKRLGDKHPRETEALVSSVDELVATRGGNVGRACGVSVYFPGENRELYETFNAYRQHAQESSGRATGATSATPTGGTLTSAYDSLIAAYADAWLAASDVDWSLPQATSSADGLALRLSDEQRAAMSSASYAVLQETKPGRYLVLTCEVEIGPDSDGVLHVPANPLVIASKTDIGRPIPGWFVQVESSEDAAVYTDTALFLDVAADYTDLDPDADPRVSATVTVADNEDGSHSVTIDSVNTAGEGVGLGGKNTVDVTQYSALIQFNYQGGMVATSYYSDGRVKPWDEWESGGWSYSVQSLENGFGFVGLPASYFGGSFAAQIVVTDVNGERHAVEPASLQVPHDESADVRQIERATDLGTLTFNVMDDHAEVAKYAGDDWTLDIPQEVEGVPVTAIANGAFKSCAYLDELALPEGITTIGAAAFAHSGLYKLVLPSTLEHVSTAAFSEMPKMMTFEVRGKSPAVCVKDGVLFSADGKTLVAYPNAKGAKYRVPKGTEVLGYGSFAGSDIAEVQLPDSVRTIDRAAFFGCEHLESLEMPDGLERIGGLAFGCLSGSSKRAPLAHMTLGRNVSYVGPRAFNGLALSSIEVDPDNTSYQGKGGMLLNAAGNAVVAAPRGTNGTVIIPDGVTAIDGYAFFDFDKTTDFILPASVQSCQETSFPCTYGTSDETGEQTPQYACAIHAPAGSFAEQFAQKNGISHDNITDPLQIAHELVMVDQDDITMAFWAYRDHAALVSVSDNKDWTKLESSTTHTLTVPETVSCVPVTHIDFGRAGSGLISGEYDTASSIETLALPSTLASVGDQAFYPLSGIKRFELANENAAFAVDDGVLLTADGKKLVAYPSGRAGAYTIPDGVKEIGPHAFYAANGLEALAIPDSVRDIGPYACANCDQLEQVSFGRAVETVGPSAFNGCGSLVLSEPFPDGLEAIGESAFDGLASYEGLRLPEGIEHIGAWAFNCSYRANADKKPLPVSAATIEIAPSVVEVGNRAFAGLGIEAFEVDEGNEAYRAEGPFLLSADGLSVVAFASGAAGEAHVPEGVREIDLDVFDAAFKVTDVYLPDSITLIDGGDTIVPSSNEHLTSIRFHAKDGSYAARYIREHDLTWVAQ